MDDELEAFVVDAADDDCSGTLGSLARSGARDPKGKTATAVLLGCGPGARKPGDY